MNMRYYSSSKIFKWFRARLGIRKPTALPMDEWEKWETEIRQSRPVAYWFTETLPDWLEKPAEWLVDPIYDVKCYVRNRWITRTHALTSRLPRGKWHEMDQRMLHCLFDELVNFVEIEKAHMGVLVCGSKQTRKKYELPWWRRYTWLRWREWRCAAAGLDHLKWESELLYDEGYGVLPGHKLYGKPTDQATAAQQTLALYQWWTVDRPARIDPSVASGWAAHFEKNTEQNGGKYNWGRVDRHERLLLKRTAQIERKYDREDQQKLIQLIRLSKSLWT
jgi:hypothetical protein